MVAEDSSDKHPDCAIQNEKDEEEYDPRMPWMSVSEDDTLQPKAPKNLLSWMTMYRIQRSKKLPPPPKKRRRRYKENSKRRRRKSLKTVNFRTEDKSTADD